MSIDLSTPPTIRLYLYLHWWTDTVSETDDSLFAFQKSTITITRLSHFLIRLLTERNTIPGMIMTLIAKSCPSVLLKFVGYSMATFPDSALPLKQGGI